MFFTKKDRESFQSLQEAVTDVKRNIKAIDLWRSSQTCSLVDIKVCLSSIKSSLEGQARICARIEDLTSAQKTALDRHRESLLEELGERTKPIAKFDALTSIIERQTAALDGMVEKERMLAASLRDVSQWSDLLRNERQRWDEKERALVAERDNLSRKVERLESLVADKDGQLKAAAAKEGCLTSTHKEAVEKLNAERDVALDDLRARQERDLESLRKSMTERIEEIRANFEAFVPREALDLFDYGRGAEEDARAKRLAIYAYLGFVNGNLRPEAFVRRFAEFDAAFYDAMRDTPDLLAECRARVQDHLNKRFGPETGGLRVCWPKLGEIYNPSHYAATSNSGQCVSEVIGAMVYKTDDDGRVLCQRKGKVATS